VLQIFLLEKDLYKSKIRKFCKKDVILAFFLQKIISNSLTHSDKHVTKIALIYIYIFQRIVRNLYKNLCFYYLFLKKFQVFRCFSLLNRNVRLFPRLFRMYER